jgi:hypothetical protein
MRPAHKNEDPSRIDLDITDKASKLYLHLNDGFFLTFNGSSTANVGDGCATSEPPP